MPCDASYMEPDERERESKEAAELIVYVTNRLCAIPPQWVTAAAKDYYGRAPGYKDTDTITYLCELLSTLTDDLRDNIVYGNPKDKTCRRLADWWERHQDYDKKHGR